MCANARAGYALARECAIATPAIEAANTSVVRPSIVIGLTGGIGSGKTAVANLFAALGVPIVDADELAREVVMPGQPAHDEIVQAFGAGILMPSGEIDRRRLRERVFADSDARKRLEAMVHPRVYAEMERRLDALDGPYAIVVIPLLIETGGIDRVDRVLVVDTAKDLQIARVSQRDNTTRSAVEKILHAQADRQTRLESADDVIDNNSSKIHLERKVAALHEQYLTYADRVARKRPEMKE